MKNFWVRADGQADWEERKKLITTALESGAEAVIVNKGESGKVRELGKILTCAPDDQADIYISGDAKELSKKKTKAFYKEINSKKDEEEIARVGPGVNYVVIKAGDWKIIPLENIIACLKGRTHLIVEAESREDAKVALETLEIGVDGILSAGKITEIKKIKDLVEEMSTVKLRLSPVKIKKVKQVGMGDRVCIDTCSIFTLGEGMLIGSQSSALFLVHAETVESEYVATRPFRVNAGPVHAYTRMPDGKTRYLSELSAGDEVLATDWKGNTRSLVIGRLKIEKRPLMLIEGTCDGKEIKTILQNAETIRLVDTKGKAVSVTSLKEGDEVLAYIEGAGRHFGMKVEESIEEK